MLTAATLILNNTWRPSLSVTGADGLPESALAPAVLRPVTSLRLNFRLPPTADVASAQAALVKAVTTDVYPLFGHVLPLPDLP